VCRSCFPSLTSLGPIPDAEREKWVNKRYMPNGPKIPKLLEKDAGASEKASKHGVLK
jgi:hypothetical protein